MGETGKSDRKWKLERAVLYGMDDIVLHWMERRIPAFDISSEARALGVWKNRKLCAGVSYERYNGVHMEVSIAGEGAWADRDTLYQLFAYPFVSLQCQALSVVVASSNLASMNLATKLGFEPEAYVKFAAHDGSALVILKMFKDQCKWIDNGQAKASKAAGRF